MIDNDICNRKIEFKAKSEIMKINRNYQKVDKKIWRVLKYKEILVLRDFLYKVCTIRLLKVRYHRQLEFGTYFFDQLEPTFLANFYAHNGKPVFRLVETKFLLSNGASMAGKAGFSLKHGNMWHIFQQSKTKK